MRDKANEYYRNTMTMVTYWRIRKHKLRWWTCGGCVSHLVQYSRLGSNCEDASPDYPVEGLCCVMWVGVVLYVSLLLLVVFWG